MYFCKMKKENYDKFVTDLIDKSKPEDRCPHFRTEKSGRPYCGNDLVEGQEIGGVRRRVCDHFSLQLFCLAGRERYEICIHFKGEPLD